MTEFRNGKTYLSFLFGVTGIVACCLFVLFIWKGGNFLIYLFLLMSFELSLLFQKFTANVCISEDTIIIVYYSWGVKHSICFQKSEADLKIRTVFVNRAGSKSPILEISSKGKVLYIIKGDNGYSQEELEEIKAEAKRIIETLK